MTSGDGAGPAPPWKMEPC